MRKVQIQDIPDTAGMNNGLKSFTFSPLLVKECDVRSRKENHITHPVVKFQKDSVLLVPYNLRHSYNT